MKDELEKKLYDKYPDLLKDAFDFSPGDGWYNLVDKLLENLSALEPGIKVAQVKEKFGSMRFYVDYPQYYTEDNSRIANALIDAAEEESSKTCEVCGEPGKGVSCMGWLKTLCDTHFKEWESKRSVR